MSNRPFTTKRTIQWGDLDALRITFYPKYYEWMDAAAHGFFHSIGLNMWDLWEKRGILFGLMETGAKYHRPGRYFSKIEIQTHLAQLSKKVILLKHHILDEEDRLLVEGFERRICLDARDPKAFKAMEIPEDIRLTLQGSLSESIPISPKTKSPVGA